MWGHLLHSISFLQMPKAKDKTKGRPPAVRPPRRSRRNADLPPTPQPTAEATAQLVDDVTEKIWKKLQEHLPALQTPAPLQPMPSTSSASLEVPSDGADIANMAISNFLGGKPTQPRQGSHIRPSAPLGIHVPTKIKDRIWEEKFVEMHDLLSENASYSSDEDDNNKKAKKRKTPSLPIWEFIPAFDTFIAIRAQKFPNDAGPMLKHLHAIQMLNKSFGQEAWQFYDRHFRLAKQFNTEMAWDALDTELYLQASVMGMKAKTAPRPTNQNSNASSSNTKRKYKFNTCWAFQEHGKCRTNNCRYPDTHACYSCKGPHSTSKCPKNQASRDQPFRGNKFNQK